MALNNKVEDPTTKLTIQPIISQVLEHLRWIQALLLDSLALLTTNTMLVRMDLAISFLASQVLEETLRNLRTSPLLGDLMFHLSLGDIALVQKRHNDKYMFRP